MLRNCQEKKEKNQWLIPNSSLGFFQFILPLLFSHPCFDLLKHKLSFFVIFCQSMSGLSSFDHLILPPMSITPFTPLRTLLYNISCRLSRFTLITFTPSFATKYPVPLPLCTKDIRISVSKNTLKVTGITNCLNNVQ